MTFRSNGNTDPSQIGEQWDFSGQLVASLSLGERRVMIVGHKLIHRKFRSIKVSEFESYECGTGLAIHFYEKNDKNDKLIYKLMIHKPLYPQ